MYKSPKCLTRRYDILDSLVEDLTASMSGKAPCSTYDDEAPMRMVYNLWNMIKNNPPCEDCLLSDQNGQPRTELRTGLRTKPRFEPRTGVFKERTYQIYSGQIPNSIKKENEPPEQNRAVEINSVASEDTTNATTAADELSRANAPTIVDTLTTVNAPTVSEGLSTANTPTIVDVLTTVDAPTTVDTLTLVNAPTTADALTTANVPTIAEALSTANAPSTVVDAPTIVPTIVEVPTIVNVPTIVAAPLNLKEPIIEDAPTQVEAPNKADESTESEAPTKAETSTKADAPTKAEAPTKADSTTKAKAPTKAGAPTKAETPTISAPSGQVEPVSMMEFVDPVKLVEPAGLVEPVEWIEPGEWVQPTTVVEPTKLPETMKLATEVSQYGEQVSSFDQDTVSKLTALVLEHKELAQQIKVLEAREREGIKLLQKADDMWTHMESIYKTKVDEAMQRQKALNEEHEEIEKSTIKWKTMTKDLESQIDSVDKTLKNMDEKFRHKGNDLRTMDTQISNVQVRIDASKREIETIEKAILTKKKHSDTAAENYANKIDKISNNMTQETENRTQKEKEDVMSINKARELIKNLWNMLLKKKIKNEDMRVQKEIIESEIAKIKDTEKDCKEKCRQKREIILEAILKMDQDIAIFKIKCSRCNESLDTRDVGNVCTDCPRCFKERQCLAQGGSCTVDPDAQCICVAVKQKFMENVFENMNAVLQKQIEAGLAKPVGEVILNCLKHSKNGKVDTETKRVLKDFILTTVRKHLNLTIVGGAVKTRCELDPDSYKKLMLCIQKTKIDTIPKEDKTTNKKSPCNRWKGTHECHCPKGPKNCVCPQKAPKQSNDPTVYSLFQEEYKKHSYRNGGICGPDRKRGDLLGSSVAERRSDPCKSAACSGYKVMARPGQGPKKLTPLSTQGSSSSQEQRSSGPSQYGSCKDTDIEQTTDCLETRKRNKANKYSKCRICRDKIKANYKASNLESSKEPHPVQQLCTSRDMSMVDQIKDLILKVPKNKPSACSKNNNKKCLGNNGLSQSLPSPSIKRRKKNMNNAQANIIELIRTPSGNPAMAFEENIIKKISKTLDEYSILHVYLRKIDELRFILKIRSENTVGYEAAAVRKSPSGNLYMDISKTIIQSPASYSDTKTAKQNSSNSSMDKDSCEAVKLCVKTENGEFTLVDGSIKRPSSHCINVDLQNSPMLKDLFNKKIPVVELLSKAGTCKLDITSIAVKRQSNNPCANVSTSANLIKRQDISSDLKPRQNEEFLQNIIKKMEYEQDYFLDQTNNSKNSKEDNDDLKLHIQDPSSKNNLIKIKPKLNMPEHLPDIENKNHYDYELYKVSVKGLFPKEKLFEPPAELRRTMSSNSVLEIDKKYDKDCRKAISIQDLNNLDKTSESPSESCIHIDFDDRKQDPYKSLGNILKTLSRNFQLTVNNHNNIEHTTKTDKHHKENKSNKIQNAFESILCKQFSGKVDTVHEKRGLKIVKASSELCLAKRKYGNVLSTLSKCIRQTDSGTYNLVLDKLSKQKLINNISDLVKTSQGVLPISSADTGEIKIQLNQTDMDKTKNKEYLRLTTSGNVYLLINEETAKGLNIEQSELNINKGYSLKQANVQKSVETLSDLDKSNLNIKSISDCKVFFKGPDENYCLVDEKRSLLIDKCDSSLHNDDKRDSNYESKSCEDVGYSDSKELEYQELFCTTHIPYLWRGNKCNTGSDALPDSSSGHDKEIKVLYSKLDRDQTRTDVTNEFFWNHFDNLPRQLPVMFGN